MQRDGRYLPCLGDTGDLPLQQTPRIPARRGRSTLDIEDRGCRGAADISLASGIQETCPYNHPLIARVTARPQQQTQTHPITNPAVSRVGAGLRTISRFVGAEGRTISPVPRGYRRPAPTTNPADSRVGAGLRSISRFVCAEGRAISPWPWRSGRPARIKIPSARVLRPGPNNKRRPIQ
jgi:hypothetical protein